MAVGPDDYRCDSPLMSVAEIVGLGVAVALIIGALIGWGAAELIIYAFNLRG